MRQFFKKLTSWWFATMVPVHGSLMSVEARETLRKRRLFSVLLLIFIVGGGLFILQDIFEQASAVQMTLNLVGWGACLFSFWMNRRGYLRTAAFTYSFFTFFIMIVTIYMLSTSYTYLSLFVWVMCLPFIVGVGLLLPAWGSLLLGGASAIFVIWFLQYNHQSHFATYLSDPSVRQQALDFNTSIILVTAIFSAIYATTTRRAVMQADRADELELAHQELHAAYTHLEQAHQTIQKQALTDGLTGLPNHRAVMDLFRKELDRACRHSRQLSVLFFDADHFKKVNDTHGHAAGDAVLRQIGERATHALRVGDTLGRFGGEEFVVLLPETDAREAERIAERIRVTVANGPMASNEVDGGLPVTVSIGLSTFPMDGTSEQELLTQADEAMYIAKQLGRNQVRTAEDARRIGSNVELMMLMQQEKQQALREREGITPERLREGYTLKKVYSLVALLAERDSMLNQHSHAVSDLATALAQEIRLEPATVARIGLAALLHDIGKVALPDRLLHQTDGLAPSELALLRKHPELGAQILEASPLLCDLTPAVRHHHEHWNGSGYPDGLAGEDIPLAARIIGIAEAYDAIQHDYPYQPHRSAREAMEELQRCAGSQFDPSLVQALHSIFLQTQQLEMVR